MQNGLWTQQFTVMLGLLIRGLMDMFVDDVQHDTSASNLSMLIFSKSGHFQIHYNDMLLYWLSPKKEKTCNLCNHIESCWIKKCFEMSCLWVDEQGAVSVWSIVGIGQVLQQLKRHATYTKKLDLESLSKLIISKPEGMFFFRFGSTARLFVI
jgi:hypothetical protein